MHKTESKQRNQNSGIVTFALYECVAQLLFSRIVAPSLLPVILYNYRSLCLLLAANVVEWSARLARKRAFGVRRLLAPLSMMHILL